MNAEMHPLQQLTQALAQALKDLDWARIEQLDSQLVAQVKAQVADPSVPQEQLLALLADLKRQHAEVLAVAEQHQQSIARELRQMRSNHAVANKYLATIGKG